MMKKGIHVVFEGLDGSGKTSILKLFQQYVFDNYRVPILQTLEPTYITVAGKELRSLLSQDSDPKANARKYFQLFVNDRKEHLQKLIVPHLGKGGWVIQDRGRLSTFAYQVMQGIPEEEVIKAHGSLPKPDVIVYVRVSPEIAYRRIEGRGGTKEKFEVLEAMRVIYENFERALKVWPDAAKRIIVLDNNRQGHLEVVVENLIREFDSFVLENKDNYFLGAKDSNQS